MIIIIMIIITTTPTCYHMLHTTAQYIPIRIHHVRPSPGRAVLTQDKGRGKRIEINAKRQNNKRIILLFILFILFILFFLTLAACSSITLDYLHLTIYYMLYSIYYIYYTHQWQREIQRDIQVDIQRDIQYCTYHVPIRMLVVQGCCSAGIRSTSTFIHPDNQGPGGRASDHFSAVFLDFSCKARVRA